MCVEQLDFVKMPQRSRGLILVSGRRILLDDAVQGCRQGPATVAGLQFILSRLHLHTLLIWVD